MCKINAPITSDENWDKMIMEIPINRDFCEVIMIATCLTYNTYLLALSLDVG